MTVVMATPPSPAEAYAPSREGRRRLEMPVLERLATGFIAGVTIIFGIVALAGLTQGPKGRWPSWRTQETDPVGEGDA